MEGFQKLTIQTYQKPNNKIKHNRKTEPNPTTMGDIKKNIMSILETEIMKNSYP